MEVEEARNFLASLDKIPMTRHEVVKELIDKLNAAVKALREEPSIWYSPEDLPNEIWRDVVGYEGLYQNSIFGRVKSFYNKKIRILSDVLDGSSYVMWRLYKDHKPKISIVHFRTYTEIGGRREVRYAGLSDEDKRWICKHYISGDKEFGIRPLARKFNSPRSTIKDVINNKDKYLT